MHAPPITLAAIRQPALLYDAGGRCVEMNDLALALAGRTLVGLTAAEVVRALDIHEPGGALLAPEDLPATRVLAGGEAVDVRHTVRAADGRTVHVLISASLLRNGDRVAGVLSIWQDVSALEEARAAAEWSAEEIGRQGAELARTVVDLERQRCLLDAILAGLPHQVSVWDRERRLVWANEQFAAGLPGQAGEVSGRSWREFGFDPSFAQPIVDEVTRTVSAGGRYRNEIEVDGPGGAAWLDVRAIPIFDDSVLAIAEDVTGRRQVEDELRRSLERLAFAQRSARSGFWDWDAGADLLTWSPELIDLFGVDQATTRTLADWIARVHPDDRASAMDAVDRALAERVPVEIEYRILLPGGQERWIRTLGDALYDGDSRPLRIAGICVDITDQKRTEQALRTSEERLRLAFENAGIGIWDHDTATDRVTVLTGFLRQYGLEGLSETTFARIFELVHPGDRERVEEWRRSFVAGGGPRDAEFRVVVPTGEERFVQFRGRVVADDRGESTRVIGVLIDVTDRMRAESALHESQERHAFLLALGDRLRGFAESSGLAGVATEMVGRFLGASSVVFCEVDAGGACTTDSAGWTDGTVPLTAGRYRPGDLGIGDEYRRGLVYRNGDAGPGALGARASLGVPICRAGRLVAVVAVYSAIPRAWTDAEVELVREVGDRIWVAVDRARTEAALREREQTLQGIFRAAPVGIGMASHRLFTMVNDRLCRMTGYARDELIGHDSRVLYADEDTYEHVGREKYARIMADGVGAVETRWRRKDGTVMDILLSSSPVDRSRPEEDVVFNALDITKLRESERALESYMDDLQRSNEELQRFAYVASHDLQEPLRSITSFSQLLQRRDGGELDADADDYIGFIVEGGNRMQTLIMDLLQLSRVETKASPLVSTDAGEVVADALRLMETSIREAGATIEVGEMPTVLADAA